MEGTYLFGFTPQENLKDPRIKRCNEEKRMQTALRCWFRPPLQRTRRKPLLSRGAGGAATMHKSKPKFQNQKSLKT